MKGEGSDPEIRDCGEEFFSAMKRAVEAELAASGYAITEHDSQKWSACYSIADKNTDGAVTLFFGPICERAGGRILPYQVVREADSRESRMQIKRDASPASNAGLFLRSIHGILTNRLPAAAPHAVGVGAGLLSIEEASFVAELQEEKGAASVGVRPPAQGRSDPDG